MNLEQFAVLLTFTKTLDGDQVTPPAVCRKWSQPLSSAIFDTLDEAVREAEGYRRRFEDSVYEVWKLTPVS